MGFDKKYCLRCWKSQPHACAFHHSLNLIVLENGLEILVLAKNRAKMVQEVLKAAGVSEDRLVLQKPMLMDAGNERDARRVEVTAQ